MYARVTMPEFHRKFFEPVLSWEPTLSFTLTPAVFIKSLSGGTQRSVFVRTREVFMQNFIRLTTTAAFALSLIIAASTSASDASPGNPSLTWKDLEGTDGRKHSLRDLADYEVVVVCFTCNTCPYAVDYEDRLIALSKKYADDGSKAKLVAINSNGVPADELDKMKERARQKRFNFPYLRDESQEVAKAFDAVYTPEFYVLNSNRQIVYRGAMDDSTNAEKVTVRYVELAVEATLQGKQPEITKTGARGCAIRFQRRRR